jgi:6-phosphofructokinase 2
VTQILTLTLNPALDLATSADRVRPGPKLRCDAPQVHPGGGGVNVSRAIRILGGDSTALVALGGATGTQLAEALLAEGIRPERLEAPGETRISLAVTDRAAGGQYRFVLPGPRWDTAALEAALARVAALAGAGALVVLSGSLPPGLPDDVAARLSRRLAPKGAGLLADTSGAALAALARAPAHLAWLRLDAAEAAELARDLAQPASPQPATPPLPGIAETAAFARDLVARGVALNVVLACGAQGNVLANAAGAWVASPPPQQVASAIGAGDSFVAGLVLALSRGAAPERALAAGSAAAAAAVITRGTELCRREDYQRILPLTVLKPL